MLSTQGQLNGLTLDWLDAHGHQELVRNAVAVVNAVRPRSGKVDLRKVAAETYGDLAAYTLVDLSVGYKRNNWSVDLFLKNAFDKRAELARFTECKVGTCGDEPYTVVSQPRTFGVRFSQEF